LRLGFTDSFQKQVLRLRIKVKPLCYALFIMFKDNIMDNV